MEPNKFRYQNYPGRLVLFSSSLYSTPSSSHPWTGNVLRQAKTIPEINFLSANLSRSFRICRFRRGRLTVPEVTSVSKRGRGRCRENNYIIPCYPNPHSFGWWFYSFSQSIADVLRMMAARLRPVLNANACR